MVTSTPPMGWNSWNTFAENINEALILDSAREICRHGLDRLGYRYVVIDDCWAKRERGKDGRLVCDETKFPRGMKALSDDLHAMGLKFGMYSCAGIMTCARYPASYDREFLDAETFASWGVDFLKYDYCFRPERAQGADMYRRMGLALANCGRDILFSACSWGADKTHEWIATTGANMWRSTGDIVDSWASVKQLIKKQYDILPYGGKDCFNDMDMLVVGMNGKGNVGVSGCTADEYRLHFAAWCLFASPLMIGCDVRSLDEETKKILTNKALIDIDQDPRRNAVILRLFCGNEDLPILVRYLANGDVALGFFNMTDGNVFMAASADDLALPSFTGKTFVGTDVYTGEEIRTVNDALMRTLAPHSCAVFRLKVVDRT